MRRPARNTLTLAVAALVAVGAAAYLAVALFGRSSHRTYAHHPLPPGVRASDVHALGRGAFRYGDFFAGIMSTSGDAPGEPWDRLSLRDNGTNAGDVYQVRAGQTLHVGRYTVRFIDVVPGDDRHVTFTLDGPPPTPAPSPSPTPSPSYADDWPH
ncbi:hypothetical protein [Streptomyces sp. NRRL F-5123]|uniref:hypothetical protein n=1 Tax=Streptomyces sp. NRRL F-5123 TaxID=1463856 RepID=UPI0004E140F4|nr:hypothetical protein [Streptomyces sp. NRRL F-5123]